MHPDLQHLIHLQDLDNTTDRLRRRIEEIPLAQQSLDTRIAQRTAAVDSVKERVAANQSARREIDKDLAAVQTRLSKFKNQLMEVKTNKEYQAMQKEMAQAEEDVSAHETRMLERMEEGDGLAAELRTAEAALKAEQSIVASERAKLDAERDGGPSAARNDACGTCQGRRSDLTRGAADIRPYRPRAQRPGHGGSARWPLRGLPCPAAASGIQRGPPQRSADSVRQLLPHPLLRSRPDPRDTLLITAYIDGGARGNPGPAGYGVHIELPDGAVEELHGPLGIATNNVAEYNGLLAALRWAVEHGHKVLKIRADSELLVKQMRGEYKVKNPGLQPLAAQARMLVAQLDRVSFEHVRREQNQDADRLSNVAMDEAEETLRNPPPPSAPLGQGELF